MVLQKTKKFLCTAVALFIGVSAISFTPNVLTDFEADAAFEKNAVETVADMGFGWNLGNSLDSYSGTTIGSNIGSLSSETAWGNPQTTKDMIDMVKNSGVETVRVPVTWYEHMDPDTYKIDDAWMDRVEEVVNYVLDDDMYCIINVHHDTGEKGWLKANSTNLDQKKEMFTAIWEQVSVNFADYGDKLLFEGYNEILDGSSNQWWNPSSEACPISNELNQIFVNTVRKSGGNNSKRNLICNTYCAGSNTEITSQFVLPNDTVSGRLIVQTHVYQPFDFTYEGAPDVTTWTSSSLDMVLNNVYDTFVKKGIPVIVGEFGCANKGNMDQITSWAKYLVESCTDKGIRCIWWDNGDLYKIYNRRTLKVSEPDLLNTMIAAAKGENYVPDKSVKGDVNDDGQFNVSDVVILQKWLLAMPNTNLANWKAADLCEDERLDVFDLCIMKRLLVQKDNMCSNEDNWSSWIDTTNGAEGEVTYNGNSISIDVKSGGINPWEAQIAYKNITLEQGATYKLSFDYVATAEVSSDCNVMQNHDDYLPYHTVDLDYTTTVQHMESEFTMTSATDKNSEIAFNCGGKSMKPCMITISNLSLIKVNGSSTDTGKTDDDDNKEDDNTTQTDVNLCANAKNWSSWVYEEEGASADVTKLDNGIKVSVQNGGTEVWYVQGSYTNVTLEKGAKYRLEFDYSANKTVSLGVNVQQNYDSYGQYYYESFDYTTTEQHFSADFTMTDATDDNVVIVFNYGGEDVPSGLTASITNLTLVKIS